MINARGEHRRILWQSPVTYVAILMAFPRYPIWGDAIESDEYRLGNERQIRAVAA